VQSPYAHPTPIFGCRHILHVGSDCGRNQTCQISTWVSKHNFLAFASIEFKVIGIGPMFDILDLGFAGILTIGRDYKVCVVSILENDIGCTSEAITT